ncbi:hypothetical protein [Ereboglobus luteus]|uniref:Uncharacterized protein n=1 Tax=Ereboglobus luteus TaxID=1796921 RepID=A0A2U8E455_9BACT|nr:hypothetical protein [Ereboglobus luteus]AWI09621.1 hypothetical protein CKA38_10510 [Ereboglobus luteus]
MKKIHLSPAPFLRALLALVVLAGVLRADDGVSLETDSTFPDIENWAGTNWQSAGWPAIQLKKNRIDRSIVQLGFDSVSPYNTGAGPNFLLRVRIGGRFVFLTNSAEVAASKPGAILMQKKERIFEGVLPNGGVLAEAAVDYGRSTVHYTAGELNPGNTNDPRFTSLRFIPRNGGGSDGAAGSGGAVSDWAPLSFGIPAYYAGANWSVAAWPGARGKTVGKRATVRLGFDGSSVYRGGAQAQDFLCRLVFKTGGTVFLSNSPEVARRKGDVTVMERKNGCFEAVIDGLGELKEVAVDFGESTMAYGRGTWSLNKKNAADVRFNSLDISPVAEAQRATAAPQAQPAKPATSAQAKEYSSPAYYGGPNWLVAVFTGARGLKLSGKNTTLWLHFDGASCFNTGEDVSFLLRVVFENGKTIYASNSETIVTAAPGGMTAKFSLNKTARYFEGALVGLGNGGAVREIAVDFGESTSHLPVPLNKRNNNNPRFTKLTVLGDQ